MQYDCENFADLGVEPLENRPVGNRAFLPSSLVLGANNTSNSRRNTIIEMIEERDIVRLAHNIARNV